MKENNTRSNLPKEGIRARIGKRFAVLPLGAGRERATVEGKRRVTVYGCRKILVYSPGEIRLQLAKEVLCVQGEGLYCSSFSAGIVTVEGIIGGVLYGTWHKRLHTEGDLGQ